MPLPKSPSTQYEENGREEEGFHNALLVLQHLYFFPAKLIVSATNFSLQELKDLRSQLHHAAEHCERAFSSAQQKKMILEGTKSYICEAVVAIVDHLGTVSSKLEQSLLANAVVKQTEQRIGCLKQMAIANPIFTHGQLPPRLAIQMVEHPGRQYAAIDPSLDLCSFYLPSYVEDANPIFKYGQHQPTKRVERRNLFGLVPSVAAGFPAGKYLVVGVVDGRNIRANDFASSLSTLVSLEAIVGKDLDEVNALAKVLAGEKDEVVLTAKVIQASRFHNDSKSL
ncbi:hypothetical protein ZIOFF_065402 [Zingiber officinale]|uniref:Uncharacterized protein n=1 Tax=Zingiber officinale TaxID=94328 RepID=A0A8J5EZL9_ZINOF|nr:hypothetical protein ZIOFF_065402 [Zingiber officinale]